MNKTWEFLKDFVWDCKTIVIPLMAFWVLTMVGWVAGVDVSTLAVISYVGISLVMMANCVYIILRERKRWN